VLVQYGIYIGACCTATWANHDHPGAVIREFLALFPATVELAVCACCSPAAGHPRRMCRRAPQLGVRTTA